MGKVFISYSHADEKWKDRVVNQLGVLEKEKKLTVWNDRQISGGDEWLPKINRAIQECDVAILLISADFLNSGFILGQEVPKPLERRAKEGIRIIPVILWPCSWTHVAWLRGIQARPEDGKPLSSFSKAKAEAALSAGRLGWAAGWAAVWAAGVGPRQLVEILKAVWAAGSWAAGVGPRQLVEILK